MIIDQHGMLVREQIQYPGSIGDSCADTFRYLVAQFTLWPDTPTGRLGTLHEHVDLSIAATITAKGQLRHPDAPEGWREEDFSSDQFLPLYLATDIWDPIKRAELNVYLKMSGFRTGNGDPISIGIAAALARARGEPSNFMDALTFIGGALVNKLPYRWSDSRQRFERNVDQSCGDWLNWIAGQLHAKETRSETIASRLALRIVDANYLKAQVRRYYAPEPNVEWMLTVFDRAIDGLYK